MPMAIYRMEAKVISRGAGHSAVAASAYMSCSRMYNDYDGINMFIIVHCKIALLFCGRIKNSGI